MTITEFLLARIAEDEAMIFAGQERGYVMPAVANLPGADPFDRALRECEAKRRIVELQAANDEDRYLPGFILLALASVYADHTDYDPGWRAD